MKLELVHINDSNFDDVVVRSSGPVLVEFGTNWCAPCRVVERVLRGLQVAYGSKVKFCYVDVATSPVTAIKCGVQSVPKLMLFRDGSHTETLQGVATPEKLKSLLDSALK